MSRAIASFASKVASWVTYPEVAPEKIISKDQQKSRTVKDTMPGGLEADVLNNRPRENFDHRSQVGQSYEQDFPKLAAPHRESGHSNEKQYVRSTSRNVRSHEDLRRKADELKRKNERMAQELDVFRKERREEVTEFQNLIKQLQVELHSARQREGELKNYCERQKQEVLTMKDEIRRAEAHHEITRYQLQEKASELQSVHLFADQADSYSGADVIALVNALNAEILQGAAVIAESLQGTPRQRPMPQLDKRVVDESKYMIGEDFIEALLFRQDSDPTIIQLALQACLVSCCGIITRAWIFGGDETILRETYARIFEKDRQSAAGRWRSMTRTYTTRANDSADRTQWALKWMNRILFLAGFPQQQSDACLSEYQGRISSIIGMTFRIRSIIGESITSVDIVLVGEKCGAPYAPDFMEDTYAEDSGLNIGEIVSGMTELGLKSRTKTDNGVVEVMMLKPKVVLRSALKTVLS